MTEKTWSVYLLECLDGSYYTGIARDVEKRMEVHKSGKGSKYVAAKGFSHLISSKNYSSRSEALKAEYKIKQLNKKDKLKFFN
jgi:putative endonuclease